MAVEMGVDVNKTIIAKCVICLEHVSNTVPFDTAIDVDGFPMSCDMMYSKFIGLEVLTLAIEGSLSLCLPCLTQLNACFQFQQKALQSARTFFEFPEESRPFDDAIESNREDIISEENDFLEPSEQYSSHLQNKIFVEHEKLEEDVATVQYILLPDEGSNECTDFLDTLDVFHDDATEIEPSVDNDCERQESNGSNELLIASDGVDNGLSCVECSRLTEHSVWFRKHFLRTHCVRVGNDLFQCMMCKRSFKSLRSFSRHSRAHQGLQQYKCQFCPKSFYYSHHLPIHERSHTLEQPFACSKCPKTFAAKYRLDAHEKLHQNTCTYNCDTCQKPFNSSRSLLKHKRIQHDLPVGNFQPVQCEKCGKEFLSRTAITYHVEHPCREVKNQEVTVSCNLCKQKFHAQQHLEAHMAEQHGSQELEEHVENSKRKALTHKHVCNVCGMKFSQKVILTRHMLRHNGERPYRCTVCNRSFAQKGTLKTHMRTHTDEKPFECMPCGTRFRSAASRRTHWRVHKCQQQTKPNPGEIE